MKVIAIILLLSLILDFAYSQNVVEIKYYKSSDLIINNNSIIEFSFNKDTVVKILSVNIVAETKMDKCWEIEIIDSLSSRVIFNKNCDFGNIKILITSELNNTVSKKLSEIKFDIFLYSNLTPEIKFIDNPLGSLPSETDKLFYDIDTIYQSNIKTYFVSAKRIEFGNDISDQRDINMLNQNNQLYPGFPPGYKGIELHCEDLVIHGRVWFPSIDLKIFCNKIIFVDEFSFIDVSPVPLDCVIDGKPCNPNGRLEPIEQDNYRVINGNNAGSITLFINNLEDQSNFNSVKFKLEGGRGGQGYVNSVRKDWSMSGLVDIPNVKEKHNLMQYVLMQEPTGDSRFLGVYGGQGGMCYTKYKNETYNAFLNKLNDNFQTIDVTYTENNGVNSPATTKTVKWSKNIAAVWGASQSKYEPMGNRLFKYEPAETRICVDGGRGGNGGNFNVNFEIPKTSYSLVAGLGGNIGQVYQGGQVPANLPLKGKFGIVKLDYVRGLCGYNGFLFKSLDVIHIKPGENCRPAEGSSGDDGALAFHKTSFISPFWLRHSLAYAEDLFLHRHISKSIEKFNELKEIFLTSDSSAFADNLWNDEIQLIKDRVDYNLFKLNNNLDYFGNVNGWVPASSLASVFSSFDDNIDNYVNTLKSVKLISSYNTSVNTKQEELNTLLTKLSIEIPEIKKDLINYNIKINYLEEKILKLIRVETEINDKLNIRAAEIRAIAETTIQGQQRKEKKLRNIQSVIGAAKIFPYGQPYLGAIATAADKYVEYKYSNDIGTLLSSASDVFDQLDPQTNPGEILLKDISKMKSAITSVNEWDFKVSENVYRTNKETLKAISQPIISAVHDINKVNGKPRVCNQEIQLLYEVMVNADNSINVLKVRLDSLLSAKTIFVQDMTYAVDKVNGLCLALSSSINSYQVIRSQIISNEFRVLSPILLSLLGNMERDIYKQIIYHQYLLVKSYEYCFVKPYDERIISETMLNEIQNKFGIQNSTELQKELLSTISNRIKREFNFNMANYNLLSQQESSYTLSKEEISRLNKFDSISIFLDISDIIKFNTPANYIYDDFKIENVFIDVETTNLMPPSNIDLMRDMSEISHLGSQYVFKHSGSESDNKKFVYTITGQQLQSGKEMTLASTSNLQSIASILNLDDNHNYFGQPSTNGKYLLSVSPDISSDINSVKLTFRSSGSRLNSNERLLRLMKPLNTTGYFNVTPDKFNRGNGINSISRIYSSSNIMNIRVSVPRVIGEYKFLKWINYKDGRQYSNSSIIDIDLTDNLVLQPIYSLNRS